MAMTEMQKNLLLLTSLCCSLASGVSFSTQQRQSVDGVAFNHPVAQSIQMFIGECLCYFVFIWYKKTHAEKYEADRILSLASGATDKINIFYFAIPALCDFISSTISFFSMNMMPLSMQYMFNGGNVIMTAAFSIIFLKRKLYRQNFIGIGINVIGLAFMGFMALVVDSSSDDTHTSSQILIAICLTIFSFFTYATQMVVEEKFFSQYFLHPFQAVGYEGIWGMLFGSLGIFAFNNINNPSDFKPTQNGKLEDFSNYLYQVFSFINPVIFAMFIVTIMVIIVLNGVGQAVTKYISSLARAVLGVMSPCLIWIFCLIVGWETFKYYQLIAYVMITFGTLIYNEILVIPYFGMNKNLRRNARIVTDVTETDNEDQQLLSGVGAKKSIAQANRAKRSFKSFTQFNDEPLDDDE